MLWRVTRLLGNFLISFKISSNEYSFLIFIYILSFSKKSFFNLLKPILNHWSHLNLLTLIKTHRNHFTSTLLKDPLPENNHTLPILHLETQTFSSPSAVLSSSPRGVDYQRTPISPCFHPTRNQKPLTLWNVVQRVASTSREWEIHWQLSIFSHYLYRLPRIQRQVLSKGRVSIDSWQNTR